MEQNLTSKLKLLGISNELPESPKYFTQFTITETLVIPEQKPDIEQLVSVTVDTEILSTKIIDTPCMKSYEGQLLSGKKLIVELRLIEKVVYVADEPEQSVHAAHFKNTVSSAFVIVPQFINKIPIERLLATGKLQVIPYVEDICAKQMDKRTISKCVIILIDVITPCEEVD